MGKFDLNVAEQQARDNLVRAVEALMMDLGAESVGRIADNIGEHGTGGRGGAVEDAVVTRCLTIIVDVKARKL